MLTLLAVGVLLAGLSVSADDKGPVVFEHRENVNLLDTWDPNVKIYTSSVTPTANPNQFKVLYQNPYYLPTVSASSVGNVWVGFDFGRERNVETIRLYGGNNTEYATGFKVQVSDDGVNFDDYEGGWTVTPTVPVGWTTSNTNTTITLNTPVNTQYLRVVPTGFIATRWWVDNIRVYGAEGKLYLDDITGVAGTSTAGKAVLDLLSTGGMAKPITIAQLTDAVVEAGLAALPLVPKYPLVSGGGLDAFIDDKGSPARPTYYNLYAEGRGFAITFAGDQLYEFSTFRLSLNSWMTDTTFTLSILNENNLWVPLSAYEEVSLEDLGVPASTAYAGVYEFSLGDVEAKGIQFVVNNTAGAGITSGPNMIMDMQLFGTPVVPEPATMSLLALGGLALLRRRK